MLNISVVPSNNFIDTDQVKREIEIQELCKVNEGDTLDKVYAKLNEKFINEIIDLEIERQRGDVSSSQIRCPTCGNCAAGGSAMQNMQQFLLIGEGDIVKKPNYPNKVENSIKQRSERDNILRKSTDLKAASNSTIGVVKPIRR